MRYAPVNVRVSKSVSKNEMELFVSKKVIKKSLFRPLISVKKFATHEEVLHVFYCVFTKRTESLVYFQPLIDVFPFQSRVHGLDNRILVIAILFIMFFMKE